MNIISIVGARPEFIQALPVSQMLRPRHKELIVHTGQHYDYLMSQKFFDELELPIPDYNLEVGSGSQANQLADILNRLEKVFLKERPDLVIVRGDTNSTLAGALAASKLQIASAHIEAGERSFDRRMPEEINRLVADHIADIHFCASEMAVEHLAAEGIMTSVHLVGDVMFDAFLQTLPIAKRRSNVIQRLNLVPKSYSLVTVHRAANTDEPSRLRQILLALNNIPETIIFPVHPRTQKVINKLTIELGNHIRLIDPVGYLDMLMLEENARLIATDSGGVQREAYFIGVPCLTLRDETEWVDTVKVGWNLLVGAVPEKIIESWFRFSPPSNRPPIFGDGSAAKNIAHIIDSESIKFGIVNSKGQNKIFPQKYLSTGLKK